MRLLLDTQSLIWNLENDKLLSTKTRQAIITAETGFMSPINFWEIAIKMAIGRDAGVTRPIDELISFAQQVGFRWLPITPEPIQVYTKLPFYGGHRDPFNRIILATALADGLTVVLSDHNFALYSNLVETLW